MEEQIDAVLDKVFDEFLLKRTNKRSPYIQGCNFLSKVANLSPTDC